MTDRDQPADGDRPARRPPPPDAVTIRCRENGPLVVELPTAGPGSGIRLVVADHLGNEFPLPTRKQAVALCRCGHSASRPFCDGSHKAHGFVAGERSPEGPSQAS
jgi:CDGSH-type Zn-finger protein